ncbi:MAG: hypothetical protein U9P72_02295 [Campylobacterota bacterium]|nr:hypothetical protein [Campylobacterota bacterium]
MKTLTINTATTTLVKAVALATNYLAKDGVYVGQLVLSGENGIISVKATDNIETICVKDIAFTSNDMTIDSFEPLAIDGKKLLKVLKAAKSESVSFDIDEKKVVVRSARSKIKLDRYDEVQKIEIATTSTSTLNISDKLSEGLKRVTHAIDSNNAKYELNGALLQVNKGVMSIVSTDTTRLPIATMKVDASDMEVIVPRRGVSSIVKLFGGYNINAKMDDTCIVVEASNVIYSTKLINGKFPEFERIVPKSFIQKLSLDRESLKSLVEEASIFENEIIISVDNSEITVSDFENNTEVIEEISAEGISMRFGIKASSAIDFLSSYNEDSVEICFNESNLPVVLKGSADYREVIMPIVLSEVEVDSGVENVA